MSVTSLCNIFKKNIAKNITPYPQIHPLLQFLTKKYIRGVCVCVSVHPVRGRLLPHFARFFQNFWHSKNSNHFSNSHDHSNQLEVVIPKRYYTLCLSRHSWNFQHSWHFQNSWNSKNSHHFQNSHYHSNQLEVVFIKRYDTWCLSWYSWNYQHSCHFQNSWHSKNSNHSSNSHDHSNQLEVVVPKR